MDPAGRSIDTEDTTHRQGKIPRGSRSLTARRGPCYQALPFFRAVGELLSKRPSEHGEEHAAESYRRAAPYLDASWQLAGSVALWTVVGWFADSKLKTTPWLLVSGSVVGMALGFYLFFKTILAMGKKK